MISALRRARSATVALAVFVVLALGALVVDVLPGIYFAAWLLLPLFGIWLVFSEDAFRWQETDPRLDKWGIILGVALIVLALMLPHALVERPRTFQAVDVYLFLSALLLAVAPIMLVLPERALTPDAKKLVVLTVLLAAASLGIHYNLAYDVSGGRVEILEGGVLNLHQNLKRHAQVLVSLSIFLAALNLFGKRCLPATRAGSGFFSYLRLSERALPFGVGAVVILVVWALARDALYSSWPLFILYLSLPVVSASLLNFRHASSYRRFQLGSLVLAVAAILGLAAAVDLGVATILGFAVLGQATFIAGERARQRELSSKVVERTLRPRGQRPDFGLPSRGWSGPAKWKWAAGGVFVLFIIGPPVLASIATVVDVSALPGMDTRLETLRDRGLAMFYPNRGEQDFIQQMYTAQMLMQQSFEQGGLVGDAFWHNEFYVPQVNSDFALAAMFHYVGVFGYGLLMLLGMLLLQIGRMAKSAIRNDDRLNGPVYVCWALAAFLLLVFPALWVIGGLALRLPWTGLVFPFVSRGTVYHMAIFVLLAVTVYTHGDPRLASQSTGPVGDRSPALDWILRGATIAGCWLTLGFFIQVHWPFVSPSGHRNVIEIPENDRREQRVDVAEVADPNFVVGNTLLTRVSGSREDQRFVEEFIYVSGYQFSRRESAAGISIGSGKVISPVLSIPPFGRYVHELHDIVLFWEPGSPSESLELAVARAEIKIIGNTLTTRSGLWVADTLRPIPPGSLIPSGSLIQIGGTVLRVEVSADDDEYLTVTVEPDLPFREHELYSRGAGFPLVGSHNVVGGSQLAPKAIPHESVDLGWAPSYDNQFDRGRILDRGGSPLMPHPAPQGELAYADKNLFYLLGSGQREPSNPYWRLFGLDHILDPVLQGKHKLGGMWARTGRSLSMRKVVGEDVRMTIDLGRQRRLTEALTLIPADLRFSSASSVILDGENRIIALGQHSLTPDFSFHSLAGSDGMVAVRVDQAFEASFRDNDRLSEIPSPLFREPMMEPLKTKLVGSAIKGAIYASAAADHYGLTGTRHFVETASGVPMWIRGIDGDHVNTRVVDGVRVLAASQRLTAFPGGAIGPPIRNFGGGSVPTNLDVAFQRSANPAAAYLALRLAEAHADGIDAIWSRFQWDLPLLLRELSDGNLRALSEDGIALNPARYVKADPVRYARPFDPDDAFDIARTGIGGKVYVSLLHLASLYSTLLVNDGRFVHPTLIRRIGDHAVVVSSYPVFDPNQKAGTIRLMKRLAQGVLTTPGTGASLKRNVPESNAITFLGGKTGSAETGVPGVEHRIFVVSLVARGEAYTIATRVDSVPPRLRSNPAVDLTAAIINTVICPCR